MNKYHKTRKFKKGDVCTFQSFGRYEHGLKDNEEVVVQADEDNGVVQIKFKKDSDTRMVTFMYLELQKRNLRFEVSKESWNDDSYAYGNKLVIRAIDNDTSRTPLIDILIPDHFEGLTEQEAVGLSERIVKILEAFPL